MNYFVWALALAATPVTVTHDRTGATITVPAYVEPCILLPEVPFDEAACSPTTAEAVQSARAKLAAPELHLWGAVQVAHGAALVLALVLPTKDASNLSDAHLDQMIAQMARGGPLGDYEPEPVAGHLFKIVSYPHARGARYVYRARAGSPAASTFPTQVGVLVPVKDELVSIVFQSRSPPSPELDAFESATMESLVVPGAATATLFGTRSPYDEGFGAGLAVGRAARAATILVFLLACAAGVAVVVMRRLKR
jgi:hypothetical protein